MAFSRLFLLTATSLVLLSSTMRAQEEDDRKVKFKKETTCLTKMNAARQEAGLGSLENSTTLISQDQETAQKVDSVNKIWADVCATLLDGKVFKPATDSDSGSSGTFALYGLGDVAQPNGDDPTEKIDPQCDAAVKNWQEGFSSFEVYPPVDRAVAYSGATREQISFVTLYNPDTHAKGQCALAACTGKPQTSDTSRSTDPKTVAGLVCFTEPTAFGKKPLFTQYQWDNIKKIFSSSASAAVPSLVAVAALMLAAFSS